MIDPKLVKKIDIIKEKDKKIDEVIRQHLNEASRDENKIWTRIQDLEDTNWINFIYKAMRTAGIIVITGIAITIMGVLIWMTIRFNQRESRKKDKRKIKDELEQLSLKLGDMSKMVTVDNLDKTKEEHESKKEEQTDGENVLNAGV